MLDSANPRSVAMPLMRNLIKLRRDLHAHPQLAYEETYASGVVQSELDRLGIPYRAGVAVTGVVAWLTRDDLDPHDGVALRADMDALPIQEETGLPYRSTFPGRMHACGHDGHTAALLGAAQRLATRRADLTRPVKLIFQPAEEGGAGAKRMIEQGALASEIGDIEVTRAFGLHGWPDLPCGHLATRVGPILAATDDFQITLQGPGGHAAVPHLTRDPVPAAAALIASLQALVSRESAAQDPVVLSVTQVNTVAGGATNVIPTQLTLGGTLRTLDPQTRLMFHQRIAELAESTAAAQRLTAKVHIKHGYPSTMNHAERVADLHRAASTLMPADHLVALPHAIMGGEDFSFIAQAVPSCFTFVGLCPPGVSDPPTLHSPRFDFNDDALPTAVGLLEALALH